MASVLRNLTVLGFGLFAQRAAQLVVLIALARTLGEAATGLYAQGVAIAGLLAVVGGAGIRNPVARAIAEQPRAARPWLAAAIRLRVGRAVPLCAIATLLAWTCSVSPWFWTLSILAALPMSFDLKLLGDTASRTGSEVLFESIANIALAIAVPIWLYAGGTELTVLAAITLATRAVYAVGAWRTVRSLPHAASPPRLDELRRRCRAVMPAQIAGDVLVAADIWIVARLCGDATSGVYALAMRIAGAAAMPSAQLARLFFAHQLHAAQRGDLPRATRVALRSTVLFLLPAAIGGAICAEPLCELFGHGFVAAAWPLRLCLFAILLQHVGWQLHQALLAKDRDRDYATTLWWLFAVHVIAISALAPALLATGAALALLLAQLTFAARAALALGPEFVPSWRLLRGPVLIALVTAAAASWSGWCAASWGSAAVVLPAQLLGGALAWAVGMHFGEMRNRWRRIGDGLTEASGSP